jgi:general secretion pathway protein G
MTSAPRRIRTGGDAGFTLIELMIVLSLIVLLAGMGLAQYRNSVTAAKEATLREDLFRMRDLLDQYYADRQQYAPSLDALVSEGYMRKIPVDPFTGNADSWQIVQADPDPANPTADPGIADVKSGAEGTALDGSNYGDW